MTSFLNRVFGRNSQGPSTNNSNNNSSNVRRGTTTSSQTSLSHQPTTSLVPLDLPSWIGPDLNRDNIRLLVFSDSDDVGLELVFDSKTLRIVSSPDVEQINGRSIAVPNTRATLPRPPSTSSNSASRPPTAPNSFGSGTSAASSNSRLRPAVTRFTHRGKQYELMKSSNDIRNYADYIFGTMPLLFKGTGMKVHTSKSPLQMMMSRIFALKLPERVDSPVNTSVTSEPDSMPMNPFHPHPGIPISRSLSSNASIVSSTISSIDVLGEDLTNQKFGRLYRRWLKCANRTMKQPKKQPGRRHRRCIGVAFIVTFNQNETAKYKHFEEFFCTHAPLIEAHFQKIMSAAEANIGDRNAIAAALLDKLFSFKDDLYTLYTRPRLLHPAWYLVTQESLTMTKRRTLAQQLCSIIDLFSTPKHGDFLNCVLSAILSYQLSWLSTVSPSLIKSKQQVLFKSKADYVNSLQSFFQYSPLWGQLLDLFSAYNQPPYICRTVLVGSNAELLNRLLYLLSYFIRPSYLTYKIPNTTLSDTDDDQNRTYKKVRLYLDELIANSIQIQDIEPYSPVQSIHNDDSDEQDLASDDPDDIDILPNDESIDRPNLTEPSDFYHLTFTSDVSESLSVDEREVSQVLELLIEKTERLLLDEQHRQSETPPQRKLRVSIAPNSNSSPLINTTATTASVLTKSPPSKTLMSLSLFEPCHLGHVTDPIVNDYHLDLALSLISSVTKSYSSDFILQAIETSKSHEVLQAVLAQHNYDTAENGCLFLNGEIIESSITIFINLDDLTVNLYSSKHQDVARRQERTKLVQPLIEHAHLAQQLLPADFVLLNIEDSLQEIYFQALAILKYIRANQQTIASHGSVSSFGDSASTTTSNASGENDDKQSLTTNNTVTDLPLANITNDSSFEANTELVQNILKKFQLQRSDYLFFKNILRILANEQQEMNG